VKTFIYEHVKFSVDTSTDYSQSSVRYQHCKEDKLTILHRQHGKLAADTYPSRKELTMT